MVTLWCGCSGVVMMVMRMVWWWCRDGHSVAVVVVGW